MEQTRGERSGVKVSPVSGSINVNEEERARQCAKTVQAVEVMRHSQNTPDEAYCFCDHSNLYRDRYGDKL